MQALQPNNTPILDLITMDQADRIITALHKDLQGLREDVAEVKATLLREEGARPYREQHLKLIEAKIAALEAKQEAYDAAHQQAKGASRALKALAWGGGGSGVLAAGYQILSALAQATGGG